MKQRGEDGGDAFVQSKGKILQTVRDAHIWPTPLFVGGNRNIPVGNREIGIFLVLYSVVKDEEHDFV